MRPDVARQRSAPAVGQPRRARAGRRACSDGWTSASSPTATSASCRAASSSASSSPARCSASPSCCCSDEPTSGVDVRLRHEILHLLDDLNARGLAIVLTTHDLNGIAAHLPRVVCLNRRVIGDGAPHDVLTPDVLERTYGASMEVLEHGGHAGRRRQLPPPPARIIRTRAAASRPPARRGARLMDELLRPFDFEFFRNGLLVATMAGALCGAIGVYVVLKGMSYIGHGLSHAIFGGFAASSLLGRQLPARRRRLGRRVGADDQRRHAPPRDRIRRRDRRHHDGVVRARARAVRALRHDRAQLRRRPVRQHPRRRNRRRHRDVRRLHRRRRRSSSCATARCCSRPSIPRSPTSPGSTPRAWTRC